MEVINTGQAVESDTVNKQESKTFSVLPSVLVKPDTTKEVAYATMIDQVNALLDDARFKPFTVEDLAKLYYKLYETLPGLSNEVDREYVDLEVCGFLPDAYVNVVMLTEEDILLGRDPGVRIYHRDDTFSGTGYVQVIHTGTFKYSRTDW